MESLDEEDNKAASTETNLKTSIIIETKMEIVNENGEMNVFTPKTIDTRNRSSSKPETRKKVDKMECSRLLVQLQEAQQLTKSMVQDIATCQTSILEKDQDEKNASLQYDMTRPIEGTSTGPFKGKYDKIHKSFVRILNILSILIYINFIDSNSKKNAGLRM